MKIYITLICVCVALLLTGCGGDSETESTLNAESEEEVHVIASDELHNISDSSVTFDVVEQTLAQLK